VDEPGFKPMFETAANGAIRRASLVEGKKLMLPRR